MPVQTYLIDAFTEYATSVTAARTILRSLVAAVLPLAGQPLYDKLGIGWGNSLLGFLALAMGTHPNGAKTQLLIHTNTNYLLDLYILLGLFDRAY